MKEKKIAREERNQEKLVLKCSVNCWIKVKLVTT